MLVEGVLTGLLIWTAILCFIEVKWPAYRKALPRKVRELKEITPQNIRSVGSDTGLAILRKYQALPESHRPAHDIVALLAALDVKYGHGNHLIVGIPLVDSHFSDRVYSLNCPCPGRDCLKFPEYKTLWNSIREVEKALRDVRKAEQQREREIELAGIENDLASIEDITAALRIEHQLLREVAKEVAP